MSKKEKLKSLLDQLNALEEKELLKVEVDGSIEELIQQEVQRVTSKVKDDPTVRTLQKFSIELSKFKKDFDLKPIIQSVKELEQEIAGNQKGMISEFESRLNEKLSSFKDSIVFPEFDPSSLKKEIEGLRAEFDSRILNLKDDSEDLDNLKSQLQSVVDLDIQKDQLDKEELDKRFEKLRNEINSRISNIGGGSMNRQMYINGVDPLTKYTDMNLKPGTNITLTYANNNTTKKVDVTITAAGGGAGAGITRSINSISISTAAGNASSTDYVYLCSGTLTLTLPDATANTNMYTVKNVGTGTVTINTTSSQTVDGNLTIVMPVQYTAVDLISDTANWSIT
jgi:hypothetical protein